MSNIILIHRSSLKWALFSWFLLTEKSVNLHHTANCVASDMSVDSSSCSENQAHFCKPVFNLFGILFKSLKPPCYDVSSRRFFCRENYYRIISETKKRVSSRYHLTITTTGHPVPVISPLYKQVDHSKRRHCGIFRFRYSPCETWWLRCWVSF